MPSAKKTPNIQLNQWAGNEYVKRQDFVDDNLKIDNAIKENTDLIYAIANEINEMEFPDTKVIITDEKNHFTGETLDVVLDELKTDVSSISTTASGTSYTDTTTQLGATNVQQAIEKIVEKVNALETELNGQVTRLSNINTELETEIGTPVQEG